MDDVERRQIALITIGHIGGTVALAELLNFKRTTELDASLCYALGLTRNPQALPTLLKILKDGFRTSFSSLNVEV